MKTCPKCKKSKELSLYHKNKHNKDGLHLWCKSCRKEESVKYLNKYFPNRRIGKKGRISFQTEDSKKISQKEWREKNKEKLKISKHNEYLKNKDKYLKRSRVWKKNNKLKVVEIIKKYRNSIKGKISRQVNGNKRSALKKSTSDNTVNNKSIMKLYVTQGGKCAISKKELNYKFHIDHIKPLSKGGKHSISNIQLVLPIENLKKGNKYEKK
jgi:5-methylcytosine-specific restriction endonuclease McrA